jgi:hypothetical protein
MEKKSGMEKPEIQQLPRVEDRITFIYLEKCKRKTYIKLTRTDLTIIP